MVACDFDLRFVYVRAGWEGSASDAMILQRSIEQGFEVPRGKYYLVDARYANTPNFIAPYRGVRYHLQEQGRAQTRPGNCKELFNLRHASLRNHVERIIGILKMRFPILKVATFHPIDSQTDIVVVACMLHNFIRIHNGTYAVEDFDNEAEETIVPNGDESYGEDVDTMNSERTTGARKRDEIAMQMWNDYCSYRRA
ncbi:protein ALP1-like [Dioscorea cayenensis subsp. rotundata]|uniref:Protein ALP1-like n=1 Tax=Dioscorea cayennensis subsp. rotundata TaxID=55577 RepID=A0AB40B4N8_DIOCR|nr:protein ALP1-like [Dioscorea cayenensis subsp. rotundata]